MSYLGDFALGKTFDVKFTSVAAATFLPTTLAGSPVISAYVDNSLTQLTAGITLTVDFDGVTGLNNVRVVATSGNGYATGTNYQLVITTGTVGGASVVGYVVGQFSIEARSALRPATADRTLVVDASGLADATAVKLGPTGAATAQTARDVGGNVDTTVSSRMATFTLPTNFSSLVIDSTGRVNAFLIGILTSVFTEGATGRIAAAFKQFFNIATPAATMDHGVLVDTVTTTTTATNLTTNNDKTGYGLSAAAVQAIWDALTSALTTAGSIGKLIVDNLNATITSRMATYTQPTGFLAATFPGTVASPTNITTVATVTNLTNAPTAGDFTAAMKTSIGTAVAASAVASVTGNVGGNVVGDVQGNVVGSVASVTGNIGGDLLGALTSTERDAICDAALVRDWSAVGTAAARSTLNALRFLRNKWTIVGGTLTVKKENDLTTAWTGAVTTAASNPVNSIDPT